MNLKKILTRESILPELKADTKIVYSFNAITLNAGDKLKIKGAMRDQSWQTNFDESDDWSRITQGGKVAPNVVIKDAATNAETDLAPYYEKITGRTTEDLEKNMEDIRTGASQYLARESVDYNKKVQQTRDSLRQRGLTFSGIGRKQLGLEGFIESNGVEGEIPTERKLDVATGLTPYEQQARDTALEGERTLGTTAFNALNLDPRIKTPYNGNRSLISTPATGIINETGDIPLEKLREKAILQAEKIKRAKLFI